MISQFVPNVEFKDTNTQSRCGQIYVRHQNLKLTFEVTSVGSLSSMRKSMPRISDIWGLSYLSEDHFNSSVSVAVA